MATTVVRRKGAIVRKTQVKGLTRGQRLAELKTFVQLCFNVIDEPDFKELANRTGLCVSTIERLARGEATLLTRFGTVQAIGYAAGLRLEWEKSKVRICLIR